MKKVKKFLSVLLMIIVVGLAVAPTISVSAATKWNGEIYGVVKSGRHDLDLGAHSNTIYLRIHIDQPTRVIYYNSSYSEIRSESIIRNGILGQVYFAKTVACEPNVRYISFHLDTNKSLLVLK